MIGRKCIGIGVILLSLLALTNRMARAEDVVQGPKHIMIEMAVFKVDLSSRNKMGLNWGKNEEMRDKDFESIVGWLEKQGRVTMIFSHRFYAADKKETKVVLSTNVPIQIERRFVSETSDERQPSRGVAKFQYKDTGNFINLIPEIRNSEISMRLSLDCEFLLEQGEVEELQTYGYGKYNIDTTLYTKDSKPMVLDTLFMNETAKDKDRTRNTAIVVLITPHIM